MSVRLSCLVLALAAASLGCSDPVHDAALAKLPPEVPGVPRGPLHRAGQPCLTCHGGEGPARAVFVFGGTVFQHLGSKTPLVGATVNLTDDIGIEQTVQSNCSGNFFVLFDEWAPAFPVHTTVSYGQGTQTMITHIGRDGSCADCHTGQETAATTDVVFMAHSKSQMFPASGCP